MGISVGRDSLLGPRPRGRADGLRGSTFAGLLWRAVRCSASGSRSFVQTIAVCVVALGRVRHRAAQSFFVAVEIKDILGGVAGFVIAVGAALLAVLLRLRRKRARRTAVSDIVNESYENFYDHILQPFTSRGPTAFISSKWWGTDQTRPDDAVSPPTLHSRSTMPHLMPSPIADNASDHREEQESVGTDDIPSLIRRLNTFLQSRQDPPPEYGS